MGCMAAWRRQEGGSWRWLCGVGGTMLLLMLWSAVLVVPSPTSSLQGAKRFGNTSSCEPCPPASFTGGQSPCFGHGGCKAGWCPTPPKGYSGPGYTPPGGNITYCTRCTQGTYQDKSGATSCKLCSPGHGPTKFRTGCERCNPGEVSSFTLTNGICVSCVELHYGYHNSANQSECIPCEAGTMSLDGATCSVCQPGFYWDPRKRTCPVACPAGRRCTSATVPGRNDTYCATCDECPPGSVQPKDGRYSCTLCPTGTFQDLQGQTACKACDVGFVQLEKGGVTCIACPAGSYCPDSSTMKPCPRHRYCPPQSTRPHTCPSMFKATPKECKATGQLIAVISCLSVAGVAVVGIVVYRWRKARHKRELEREVLLRAQKQRRRPVYSGL
ncbi:hypothetical protein PTSG_00548 [Salpingoeca rosetta]|uniref:Tyrosine-protein kinase ephrin type A/B receptor-like domain-containing protein n=1 Tax=Salpingoeca rosetta (strain ATCC 50818 / BSB-021) TaxID=946362 RepID=F2TWT0_SALR5|nr:uncharacterized protein PTSG_00548 [Salpingoeca rosetta]EGD72526.1 hypothetical protein PTSG_00548 [Salpingoeca rosetta]|eukprot:XP_004999095.1 hypothetical protein PTSG_00548 [Salpingoeca rosetta]